MSPLPLAPCERPATPPVKPAPRYATALFPTGDAAAPIRSERVMILDLWESVSACAAVSVDAAGVPMLGTEHRHVLPLRRVCSAATFEAKSAALLAQLISVAPGNCPECWQRGRAIPAASPEKCPFVARHFSTLSAPTEAQRPSSMPVTTTPAGAAPL